MSRSMPHYDGRGVRQRVLRGGSKKRVARIHWSRRDLVHAGFWSLIVIGAVLWVAVWISGHTF